MLFSQRGDKQRLNYSETRIFLDGSHSDAPHIFRQYEKLHFAPGYLGKGILGTDYHNIVRELIRDLILSNTDSPI